MKITGTESVQRNIDISFGNILQAISRELTGRDDWKLQLNPKTETYDYQVFERCSRHDYDYVTKRQATEDEVLIFTALQNLQRAYNEKFNKL